VAAYEHGNVDPRNLLFEPNDHVYKFAVSGHIIPSVTQILKEMGEISEFAMQSERARERGTIVHIAASFLPDRLDWTTVDRRILGYVMSCAQWFETTGCVVQAQEQRVYIPEINVAGTLDLRGTFPNGKSGTLYLQEDGSLAKFKACDVRKDWQIFVSMVNVWRYRNGN
jgi:hypothetical protein